MENQFIQLVCSERVATIKLNRPKANALSGELLAELQDTLKTLRDDAAIGCVVITGEGDRFFSGGADIPTLKEGLAAPFAEGAFLPLGVEVMNCIESYPKPVVAAVNGIAVGGGCELSLACHVRIASENAQFGQPEINLGIVPGWGGCHRLPRLIGESRAMEWLLTGRMVSAQEALAAGLTCQVVPLAELAEAAAKLAGVLAGKPPVAVRALMQAVRGGVLQPERGAALEAEAFSEAAESRDATEGISAFLEKRNPEFRGE